jgi:hypothetical protein
MTTTSDALEIMAVVAACHHRTAPRMDDPEATRATAQIWAELFDGYGFTKAELIAAVKVRAQGLPDAPEPADLIRVARSIRSDAMGRTVVSEDPDDDSDGYYPGDAKAAPDLPEYPREWDSKRRLAVYWYAMSLHAIPTNTSGWQALADQLDDAAAKREHSFGAYLAKEGYV